MRPEAFLGSVAPASVYNGSGHSKVVLVCEHASNHVPPQLNGLGLPDFELTRHIAWDPGAFSVAKRLSDLLDAPLVYANVSRLVLDINRQPGHRGSIVEVSELTEIPGNKNLTPLDRETRARAIYEPFHEVLRSTIERRRKANPWIISIHSYTPIYKGVPRPWHAGILHNDDRRLSTDMLEMLRQDPALNIGDNEPYAPIDGVYHTVERHTKPFGYKGAMVEIRNDLIADANGEQEWAERFHQVLTRMLAVEA
ncbi:N-formylglutamate amidohydrolase [Pseudorhizobium flavum]|uniref:Putative N-formylglutamate amidohydrolase n=1 Tax=Pseudorhizobium flavum TaxID=1335061 RepID=A0A7W9Z363_9HYPH|nr:N-formylglutamate amidohydrolase [Pseudorhizobium flavum]MBB6182311.1 putative N-formylglutamate amidohydrolase [Pseudorhizobium flavum]CAD6629440.1 N-formylglutamate amidohydrolase [Pseudorhizobium flavum]